MQINLQSPKTVRRIKKVFAVFMLPIFMLQMVSANLLFLATPLAHADETIAAISAPVKVEAPAEEKKIEPVTVEKPEPKVEAPAPTPKIETPAPEATPATPEKTAVPAPEPTQTPAPLELPIEPNPFPAVIAPTDTIAIPAVPAIDPIAASIEAPVDQESGVRNQEIGDNIVKALWVVDGNKATTNYPVELGKTYTAPQNSQVTVTFTKLPEAPGTLSIEEIKLSDEQVKSLGALSNKAYDVTSSMENGTFQFDLTLPKPSNANNVQIKFAEDVAGLDAAQTVAKDDTKTQASSVSASLDHFTVFVVVDPNAAATDVAGLGTVDWTGAGNVFTSNNLYASVSLEENETSHYLKASNFGLQIPAGSTITGIQVQVEINGGNSGGGHISDRSVRLMKNGVLVGDEKSVDATWPSTDTIATFGGPSDTWGQTWTVDDINSANTGFAILVAHDGSGGTRIASVDHIAMTVTFAPPAEITSLSFANRTGVVTGGSTVALNLSEASTGDLASGGSITVTEDSVLEITSPLATGPIALNSATAKNLGTVDIFGFNITADELRATAALPQYAGVIPVLGTLTNPSGFVTNITINLTVDVTAPTINTLTFASRTGTITAGKNVALDLRGVTEAQLALTGNISVSEISNLQITSPIVVGPISLNSGPNAQSTGSIFGFPDSITLENLRTTALLFPGGIIPVIGTLTDFNGNTTDISISITVDVTPPTISALSFVGRTGTVISGDTVNINLSGITTDAQLLSSGNITVSEDSTLQITFPQAAISPVFLTKGVNSKNIQELFLFPQAITAQDLIATGALFPGGIIPVSGTLTDPTGNTTNVTINISTIDIVAPVITLIGNQKLSVYKHASYIDAGATAFDNVDGNITSRIVAGGAVDTENNGTYTLTYNVQDLAGNIAQQVIRTVIVRSKPSSGGRGDDNDSNGGGSKSAGLLSKLNEGNLFGGTAFAAGIQNPEGNNIDGTPEVQGTETSQADANQDNADQASDKKGAPLWPWALGLIILAAASFMFIKKKKL